ncbi:hypothetical protein L1887_61367 [Cichorium endivia]|nr:hypothetical protein L1887_61367 [Cichorium endivia]
MIASRSLICQADPALVEDSKLSAGFRKTMRMSVFMCVCCGLIPLPIKLVNRAAAMCAPGARASLPERLRMQSCQNQEPTALWSLICSNTPPAEHYYFSVAFTSGHGPQALCLTTSRAPILFTTAVDRFILNSNSE